MVVLPRFDPAEVLETIEKHRINSTMLVPKRTPDALMDHPDSHTRDLSSLETIYYGAAAISPTRLAEVGRPVRPDLRAVLRTVRGAHGHHLLLQAGPLSRPKQRARQLRAPFSAFLRTVLLDEQDQPVPVGEPGEICVAGPLLAGGYWNLPEETD